jgi:hypothetical protein
MKIGIQQPNYIPWSGYFHKISQCDLFIFLDNVKCPNRGYVNRAKIKSHNGELWLTQPLPAKGRTNLVLSEVKFSEDNWRKKHIKTMQGSYSQAPFFKTYFPRVEEIIMEPSANRLTTMNSNLIKLVMKILDIQTKTLFASDMNSHQEDPTDRLIHLVKNAKGTVYLSGEGGANYQEEEKIKSNGIELQYTNFSNPVYPQLWGEFCPGLSIVDLIFNCGPEGKKHIE